jgi:hypothetical protein
MRVDAYGTAMKVFSNAGLLWLALLAAIVFVSTAERLKDIPRESVSVEMQVALPLFVQVAMAGGDRFLAANVAAIRSLVVETAKMRPDEFAILAKVQEDVAWLNPGHEDNYYVAAAILPWVGQVESAQRVLAAASHARRFDYQPAFLYAFNQLHFNADPVGASAWMREAAEYLPEGENRLHMQNLAAIWLDRAKDLNIAIGVVEAMAAQSKRNDFRRYLEIRANRLRNLRSLRDAAARFQQRFGKPLTDLSELASIGFKTPPDPFGFGYEINKGGDIVLRNSAARQ